jgi:PKD repeat protein
MPWHLWPMRWCVLPLLLFAGCGGQPSPAVDARPYVPPPDSAPTPDAPPPPLAVDFTAVGCLRVVSTDPTCTGAAPFTVQFVPITSQAVIKYSWNFGDGSSDDTSPAPSHTFQNPGSFNVMLAGFSGTGELVTHTRPGFVIVSPTLMGGTCQADEQCDADLACLCSKANPCTAGPLAGMCTTTCGKQDCPGGMVCANLATTPGAPGRTEPWQTQICLPQCLLDTDCGDGLKCRSLPSWPTTQTQVHGCFTDAPVELGDSCLDAAGAPRNDLCLSGLCADLGALGLCSRNCSDLPCSAGSDCAVFGDDRELCLVPCSSSSPCNTDPLLTCVAPGLGPLGYQLKDPPSSSGGNAYCAPKPCASNADCSPAGTCSLESGGGHCVARPR